MRLHPDQVQYVKAAEGHYTMSDVARHYGVHPSTIKRIWDGVHHTDIDPARELPNIPHKLRAEDLYEDIRILLARGMTNEEVANTLDCSTKTVWAVGRSIFL